MSSVSVKVGGLIGGGAKLVPMPQGQGLACGLSSGGLELVCRKQRLEHRDELEVLNRFALLQCRHVELLAPDV